MSRVQRKKITIKIWKNLNLTYVKKYKTRNLKKLRKSTKEVRLGLPKYWNQEPITWWRAPDTIVLLLLYSELLIYKVRNFLPFILVSCSPVRCFRIIIKSLTCPINEWPPSLFSPISKLVGKASLNLTTLCTLVSVPTFSPSRNKKTSFEFLFQTAAAWNHLSIGGAL